MLENILTVAGAVAQSAEQTNKLMVANRERRIRKRPVRPLRGFFGFRLLRALFDHFLESDCGMNAPVKDETFRVQFAQLRGAYRGQKPKKG